MIIALSYIGVRSDCTEDWRAFAGRVLGMQVLDRGGRNTALRMDDKVQRLIFSHERGDTLAYIGWDVSHKSDLDVLASRLEFGGYETVFRR